VTYHRAEAFRGIFAADEVTAKWYRAKGMMELPYPLVQPGVDALYEIDEELDLSGIVPMVAKPFSPGNAFPADDVAQGRLPFDKALTEYLVNRRARG
jgi:homoaconitase/3-isopropylmalate dehydratase large subunit